MWWALTSDISVCLSCYVLIQNDTFRSSIHFVTTPFPPGDYWARILHVWILVISCCKFTPSTNFCNTSSWLWHLIRSGCKYFHWIGTKFVIICYYSLLSLQKASVLLNLFHAINGLNLIWILFYFLPNIL